MASKQEVFVSQFQPPPGYPPPGFQPQRRGNAAAIASLVLGLLGCIPFITGLLAVIFGIIGIRRARDPQAGGNGFAIAGLILGILSVAIWCFVGGSFALLWVRSGPQRVLAREFIEDLSKPDIPAARALSASTLGLDRIESWSDRLSHQGKLQDVSIPSFFFHNVNGTEQWTLLGRATYATGEVTFTMTTVRQGNEWRVYRLVIPKELGGNNKPGPTSSQPAMPETQPIGPNPS
jgi:hypothetical protein